MKTENLFPKNKKQFLNLIKFYKTLAPLLKKAQINPIATGSLAYFIYTQDKNTKINDFDFLIPQKKLRPLILALFKVKIKCKYLDDWKSIEVMSGKLKIDFDSFERYYKGKGKIFQNASIQNTKIRLIGLDALIEAYKFAARASNDKPAEHKNKFEKLVVLKKVKKQQ